MATHITGPRLGTKLFILMFLSLLVIPWFSYRYITEMEDFLVESQSNAQLLTAEGISTLLNGRKDLFYDLPLSPEGYEQLYAHPLTNPIRLDGKVNDWEDVLDFAMTFGQKEQTGEGLQTSFELLLGEQKGQIYAMVHIRDEAIVFRDGNILRLDLSDHLRITFTGPSGAGERLVMTMPEPGVTTTYSMDQEWKYAIEGGAENRVQGFMAQVADGYIMEFRMPLAMLGTTRHFGLAVVDVDQAEDRRIKSITVTLPSAGSDAFGLVVLKSPEVLRIIEGLEYSGARIQVIDVQARVRAEVGSYRAPQAQQPPRDTEWPDAGLRLVRTLLDSIYGAIDEMLQDQRQVPEETVIKAALQGTPTVERRFSADEGETIIAAHPIIGESEVIGTVVLKQNTSGISQLRREALERIISFSVSYLLIFVILILTFSVRLARRIRKLGLETTNAIDIYGRLQTDQLRSETRSSDEIGDLARSISSMLAKLHQHNQFLENMPRTLRHEINNPLNTLSTSLQNLESEDSPEAKHKYLESAKRGVMRIGMIIQNLADAANLEDALEAEELEVVDLQRLVNSYLANCQLSHPEQRFVYAGTQSEVLAKVSDYRIEQLLDKLIDNAVDFTTNGRPITIGLTKDNYNLALYVLNEGPPIPDDKIGEIFDSMVSVRTHSPDTRLHFGLGLYVVRVIAQYHGGSVRAKNLGQNRGVMIEVTMPLYRSMQDRMYATG